MKKIYIAIGHFKWSENITSVVLDKNTRADFIVDCRGNEFVPYIVMTEKMLNKILEYCGDGWEVFVQVKKMTTNYRKWNIITDYITQCGYIITEQVEKIKKAERQ